MTARVVLVFVLCLSGVFAIVTDDEYMVEVQKRCETKSDFVNCGKYEILKYISKTTTSEPTKTIGGTVELITIAKPETAETLFSAARQRSEDSEVRKIVKFLQRQMNSFLGSRAIAISLPEQIRLVDSSEPSNEIVSDVNSIEARASKKKKVSMILPLIMLFKLFKVKVLLAAVLFGVLFIKKALVVLFLLAPSYLQMLKICKQPHYQHASHIEEHDFGGTGYGHVSHPGHHAGYGKEWASGRAYAAYQPKQATVN